MSRMGPLADRQRRMLCWLVRLAGAEADAAIYAYPRPADYDERLDAAERLRNALEEDLARVGEPTDEEWERYQRDFLTPDLGETR